MAKIHVADREYFEELQNALDTLLAGYFCERPGTLASTPTALDVDSRAVVALPPAR